MCKLPCIRYKVTDIQFFRLGRLRTWVNTHTRYFTFTNPTAIGSTEDFLMSRRWLGKTLKDITTWQSMDVKEVELTQDHENTCIRFSVRRFVPIPGDTLTYQWLTPEGVRSLECAPYAIADIQEASRELYRHVNEAAVQHVRSLTQNKNPIVQKTFSVILSIINQVEVRYFVPSCRGAAKTRPLDDEGKGPSSRHNPPLGCKSTY